MSIKKFFAYLYDTTLKTFKIGDTSGSNYTEFKSNGALRSVGTSLMWDDIIGQRVAGASSLEPVLTTVLGNLKAPTFTNSGTDEEFWQFEITHNTKIASLADIHYHMMLGTTANNGNVKMNCEYWTKKAGVVIGAGTLLTKTIAFTGATDSLKGVNFEFTDTLDLSTFGIGDHLLIRITRDNTVASNLNASIFGIQAGVHRQIDGFGSDERLSKTY